MAATVTTYNLRDFSYTEAKEGALCVMVLNTVGSSITDAEYTGSGNPPFMGTGIIRSKSPNNNILIIESKTYTFNSEGRCITKNYTDYVLKLGIVGITLSEAGNEASTTRGTTISGGGESAVEEQSITYEEAQPVSINTLNARDQFAVQALRGMLAKIEDPSTLSTNEMNMYCKRAYEWAANMMTEAGFTRIKIEDNTESVTEEVEVQSLQDNTEKLLNNLIIALERTDEKIIEGEGEGAKTTYAERISIPSLITFLQNYTKHTKTSEEDTKTSVGLEDLIEAIKDISAGEGGSTTVDFTTLIEAINGKQTTGTINIGESGLGRDTSHPIYISGGGFPSRAVLAAALPAASIHDLLTFNEAGAVGYSTKDETKKALLGFLNDYADLAALYTALQASIDTRIKAWLNATTIVADGSGWKLNVPDNI